MTTSPAILPQPKSDPTVTPPSGANSLAGTSPRAKERVEQYLYEQFNKLDLTPGSRLPTSRVLAAQLDVSVSTVQAVFRDLAKKGIIKTEVGNGSFLIKRPQEKSQTALRIGITFGFAADAPKSEPWHLSICGALLSSASRMDSSASIVPIQFNPGPTADVVDFLERIFQQVDSVILRSVTNWPQVESKLSNPNFPIVHLNPMEPTSTSNFVSTDFFKAGSAVGAAFSASKRKRVVFLHSLPSHLSVSSSLRYSGLVTSLANLSDPSTSIRLEVAQENSQAAGEEIAKQMFANRETAPDAIYTVSERLAMGVMKFCRRHCIRIPEDLSIVVTGFDEYSSGGSERITCEQESPERIGSELLTMVLARAKENGRSQPGVYVLSQFRGGATTRPEENEALQIL